MEMNNRSVGVTPLRLDLDSSERTEGPRLCRWKALRSFWRVESEIIRDSYRIPELCVG